jgi:hypothetical protein
MDTPVGERRAHERADGPWAQHARVTLRPGHLAFIVNISRGGALVDSTRQMRPGTRVFVQIATRRGELGLSALVLRCNVRSVSADDGVLYRGALRFDERRDWTRELATLAG